MTGLIQQKHTTNNLQTTNTTANQPAQCLRCACQPREAAVGGVPTPKPPQPPLAGQAQCRRGRPRRRQGGGTAPACPPTSLACQWDCARRLEPKLHARRAVLPWEMLREPGVHLLGPQPKTRFGGQWRNACDATHVPGTAMGNVAWTRRQATPHVKWTRRQAWAQAGNVSKMKRRGCGWRFRA